MIRGEECKMIQDISPHKLDNRFYPERRVRPEDYIIIYKDRQIIVNINEEEKTFSFPRLSEIYDESKAMELSKLTTDNTREDQFTYLFSIDDRFYFLYRGEDYSKLKLPTGYDFMTVRSLTAHPLEPKYNVYAAFTSMHLAEWYDRQKFCSRCGRRLIHSDNERAMKCVECGHIIYPRLNPAVIVGVRNGDSLLLTKYKHGYGYNALVAGFVEIGETIEECVEREVKEETGLSVKNITYYKSQPWGIAGDLLTGFYCDVDGDDTIHMDDNELRYAEWVKRDEIELQPAQYSLTNEMMMMFKKNCT